MYTFDTLQPKCWSRVRFQRWYSRHGWLNGNQHHSSSRNFPLTCQTLIAMLFLISMLRREIEILPIELRRDFLEARGLTNEENLGEHVIVWYDIYAGYIWYAGYDIVCIYYALIIRHDDLSLFISRSLWIHYSLTAR